MLMFTDNLSFHCRDLCVVFNLIGLTVRPLELICTLQTQQTINLSPSYFLISSPFLSILSKNVQISTFQLPVLDIFSSKPYLY